jgi:hypothetical protein
MIMKKGIIRILFLIFFLIIFFLLYLADEADTLLLGGRLLVGRRNDSANGLVENVLETLLSQSRAFHVFDGLDLLRHLRALLRCDGRQLLLGESVERFLVLTHIELGADEDHGSVGTMMLDLGHPFGADVLERGRRDDGEAHQKDVRLRIGQRAQAVIILLSSGIPEAKIDGLVVDHDVGAVVVKDSGDILAREGVGGVRNEKARLTDGSVADDDTLDGLHYECSIWRVGLEVKCLREVFFSLFGCLFLF